MQRSETLMIVTKNKKFFVEITTPSELIEYKNDSRFKKFTEEVYDRCVSILDSHEKISSCDLHKKLQGLNRILCETRLYRGRS